MKFKWIGGATWILEVSKIKIACDPVLCPQGTVQDYFYFKSTRLNNPEYNSQDFDKIDLWLLSHNHEDHIDDYGLEIVKSGPTIIAHPNVKKILTKKPNYTSLNIQWLKPGQKIDWQQNEVKITVYAIPAIHAKRKIFSYIVGNANGYVLDIVSKDNRKTIYITGDGVYNQQIHNQITHILKGHSLNLIIANAGSAMVGKKFLAKMIGRITNNSQDIKKMIRELKPKSLIPVHWGTFSHYAEILTPAIQNQSIRFMEPGQVYDL